MAVAYEDLPTTNLEFTTELEALWRQLKLLYTSYTKLNEKAATDLSLNAKTGQDIDYIVDTIAVHINNISFDERQKILETVDLHKTNARTLQSNHKRN